MEVMITPKAFYQGEIDIPCAKSHFHRALIAAALCKKPTILLGKAEGNDVFATIRCLESLGARIIIEENSVTIIPINELPKTAVFKVGESGTTMRMLMSVACALGVETQFVCEGRLANRPIEKLVVALRENGGIYAPDSFTLKGRLHSGKYVIDGSESSQYISGLLFALPMLSGDSEIEITRDIVSKPYINMTLAVLKDFGISIEEKGNGFFIKGGQNFVSPESYIIEKDWSGGAFFAVLGAMKGKIVLKNMLPSNTQADYAIVELLKKAGGNIVYDMGNTIITQSELHGVSYSVKDCPDLAPIAAVLASVSNGVTEISDVDRLCIKESDRLKAIESILDVFGVKYKYENDKLTITGGMLKGGKIDGFSDHRMVMAATVGASFAKGKTEITTVEAVKKSFPSFFEEYKKLGGIYAV